MKENKRYLCLLRGVNVSGQKLIKMSDLKTLLYKNGLDEITTYIQSGNIVFTKHMDCKEQISTFIEHVLKKEYGWEVPSLILTKENLNKILENNPYPELEETSTNKPYVCIPKQEFLQDKMEALNALRFDGEFFTTRKYGVYLYCTKEANKCKLSTKLIEKKLKAVCTTRNWRTLLKLQKLF